MELPAQGRAALPDEVAFVWHQQRWCVRHPELKNPLAIDFDGGDLARRMRQGGEMLARACGAAKGLSIIDATAGLGRDAVLLAGAGARVIALEQNTALAWWLTQNLEAASQPLDVQCIHQNSVEYLQNHTADVVYLDPMFPHREKSAAVGGESKVLQAFAGVPSDLDEAALFEAAWQACEYRVVVKRPIKASPLANRTPASSLKGKAVRFDLYGKRKLP